MSEQATMTREQLEAAGYRFSFPEDTFPNDLVFPLQWGHSEHAYVLVWSEDEAYNIATQHYRQQEELEQLRMAIIEIDAYCRSEYGAIYKLKQIASEAGKFMRPTVSESERAE